MTTTELSIGPEHTDQWWSDHGPKGRCSDCGGQCDGNDCGLHRAGCVFGGPLNGAYWLVADSCPLWHGDTP